MVKVGGKRHFFDDFFDFVGCHKKLYFGYRPKNSSEMKEDDTMKKLFTFLLTLTMVLTLAACGGKEEETPAGNEDKVSSSSEQQEDKTPEADLAPAPEEQEGAEEVAVSTDWSTKPFHIKGTAYSSGEPDGEMEVLYDGEALLIWNGEDGEYVYLEGDTLMEKRLYREDGSISLRYNGEAVSSTIPEFMENEADFLSGMIFYTSDISNCTNAGDETIEGFDCMKYETEEDFLGNTYVFWIDKATGIFVKEHTEMTLDIVTGKVLETPEIDILYVANYISVDNVPSVASVYEIPSE